MPEGVAAMAQDKNKNTKARRQLTTGKASVARKTPWMDFLNMYFRSNLISSGLFEYIWMFNQVQPFFLLPFVLLDSVSINSPHIATPCWIGDGVDPAWFLYRQPAQKDETKGYPMQ